ncbi:hypothetical protein M409DRAFT_20774 [Zasmidium cellare ATCC 36951]|uniref:Uncharacterized protein n=1 Tax=Zasmidium cellare ATCC 36951 TaxID=1080233 RepID=A0A6A6CNA3_ZASCE|nr:uncharacterized protein M409DRAFT_20774 [Zasmidium cellare ATCC 36951]KAF2168757.1 hypothetical protein M409DRAFT_20774 [Zasmidium cellare ATCC 36951]
MDSTSRGGSLHPAASAGEWNNLVAQGQVLLEQMWDDENIDQSPFQPRSSLERWGWVEHGFPRLHSTSQTYVAPLHQLRGVEGLEFVRDLYPIDSNNSRWWTAIRKVHSEPYENPIEYRQNNPTGGRYSALYNIHAHVLLWTENHDPREAARSRLIEDLPELLDFCDVGFLTYREKRENKVRIEKMQPLAWFHVPHLEHRGDTLRVVTRVMDMFGHRLATPGTSVTVPIGSEAYNALLATPCIRQFARLLIRYKHVIGVSVITSITVYHSWTLTSGSQPGHDTPGFLVHAAPFEKRLAKIRSENSNYEDDVASRGRYDWPHKLKPRLYLGKGENATPLWQPPLRPSQSSTGNAIPAVSGSSIHQPASSIHDQRGVSQNEEAGVFNPSQSLDSVSLRIDPLYEGEKRIALLQQGQKLQDAMWSVGTLPPQYAPVEIKNLTDINWRLTRKMSTVNLESLRFLEGYVGLEDLIESAEDKGIPQQVDPVSIAFPHEWYETQDQIAALNTVGELHSLISYKRRVVAQLESSVPYPPGLDPNANPAVPGSQTMPDSLPPIRDWGDVVSAEYFSDSPNPPSLDHGSALPKWWPILANPYRSVSPSATEVITDFLTDNGLSSVPGWPGITLPIGTLAYVQLLASPEIRQIVWPLITHKSTFGDATIASITVFDSNANSQSMPQVVDVNDNDDHSRDVQLNFVPYVQQRSEHLRSMLKRNSDFDLTGAEPFPPKDTSRPVGPLTSKDGPKWPCPLWPVRNFQTASTQMKEGPGPDTSKGPSDGSSGKDKGKGKGKDNQSGSGRGSFFQVSHFGRRNKS